MLFESHWCWISRFSLSGGSFFSLQLCPPPSGPDWPIPGRLNVSSLPSSAWTLLLQRPGQWKLTLHYILVMEPCRRQHSLLKGYIIVLWTRLPVKACLSAPVCEIVANIKILHSLYSHKFVTKTICFVKDGQTSQTHQTCIILMRWFGLGEDLYGTL